MPENDPNAGALRGGPGPMLFMSYDGLTSLIGQSQVLPYVTGLAERGFGIEVVSFEAPDRLQSHRDIVNEAIAGLPIVWNPRAFRSRPPLLSKLVDQADLRITARRRALAARPAAVHCRSYVTAVEGRRLKLSLGLPFIFDMRGFWVDQRREGGAWPADNPFYRRLYEQWKRKERGFVAAADQIVVLTEAARDELQSWPSYNGCPVEVIPCALEHSKFPFPEQPGRAEARRRLGIRDESLVLTYLGSLGTVYCLPEMLTYFAALKRRHKDARFLFIGRNSVEMLLAAARAAKLEIEPEDLLTVASEHADVPYWLGAADLAISFIIPTYSSLGVSPTKLAEYLACGLPVVCNRAVGDVETIVKGLNAGRVLSDLRTDTIVDAAGSIEPLLSLDRRGIRAASERIHDRSIAIDAYARIYERAMARPAQQAEAA